MRAGVEAMGKVHDANVLARELQYPMSYNGDIVIKRIWG